MGMPRKCTVAELGDREFLSRANFFLFHFYQSTKKGQASKAAQASSKFYVDFSAPANDSVFDGEAYVQCKLVLSIIVHDSVRHLTFSLWNRP